MSDWDAPDGTPGIGRWDATPGCVGYATPSVRRNRWDETPTPGRMADADATPAAGGATPGATPSGLGMRPQSCLVVSRQPLVRSRDQGGMRRQRVWEVQPLVVLVLQHLLVILLVRRHLVQRTLPHQLLARLLVDRLLQSSTSSCGGSGTLRRGTGLSPTRS